MLGKMMEDERTRNEEDTRKRSKMEQDKLAMGCRGAPHDGATR